MTNFIGKKFRDIIKLLPKENIEYELNYVSCSNEAFGDLRVVSQKYENNKWFFVLSFENYQQRSIRNVRDTKRKIT